MKEIKDRWQFIIGFAAIVISLGAFKEELTNIKVDYHFISFSLFQYLFVLTISFISVIHLYVIPYIFSSTKYSNLKLFNHIESLSYFLFLIIILSPSILLIVYLLQLLLLSIYELGDEKKNILSSAISLIILILNGIFSIYTVNQYQTSKKLKEESNIIEKEIEYFEVAEKLIKDGYYSQSFVEIFKIIEIGVYKVLRQKDLVFRKGSFLEMINIANKYNIFNTNQIQHINEIRIRRNQIAHNLESNLTRIEVENALNIAKEILIFSDNSNITLSESNSKFFKGKVFDNLEQAQELSTKSNKPIFIVIYDKNQPKISKLDYSLGYFMEYETTKKIVSDNFIQVLIDSDSKGAKELIPLNEPLENCLLTILSPKKDILKQEGVYANPDEGLKRVNEILASWRQIASR